MKRALDKIWRLFFPWGWAKCLLGLVLLVALLYCEEDWRGAHAWTAAEAQWEGQGGTLDYSKLAPPPVPDEKNLAALPLFKIG